jgi:heme-degrading monooxygenase HmoA
VTETEPRRSSFGATMQTGKTMVARIWRGTTPLAKAVEYRFYLYEQGVQKIEGIPGNLGVMMYQSDSSTFSDFTVISFWPDHASIVQWAGENIEKVRHLERDPEYLVSLPEKVQHAIVHSNSWLPPSS